MFTIELGTMPEYDHDSTFHWIPSIWTVLSCVRTILHVEGMQLDREHIDPITYNQIGVYYRGTFDAPQKISFFHEAESKRKQRRYFH